MLLIKPGGSLRRQCSIFHVDLWIYVLVRLGVQSLASVPGLVVVEKATALLKMQDQPELKARIDIAR